jgi:hypothetical protein
MNELTHNSPTGQFHNLHLGVPVVLTVVAVVLRKRKTMTVLAKNVAAPLSSSANPCSPPM